jgi:predicted TIM-barrel fold metal-dependent hydrolase
MDYKLISADSHILEPPDLWTSRMPAKYKDRAAHMVSLEKGDAWVVEGAPEPFPFGLNQCGGLPPEEYKPWVRWEEVRPGAHSAASRIAEMDEGKVDAEVMYPTPRVSTYIFTNVEEPEFHIAQIRAYNDWLSEFCSYNTDRLRGVAMLPNVGVDAALEEMDRALALPGLDSVLFGQYPHGGTRISAEDDRLWAAAVERDTPVNIHVGLVETASGPPSVANSFVGAFTGAFRFFDAPVRIGEFIYTKAFDRFPKLKLVLAEVDMGWVGYFAEQIDDRYRRQNPVDKVKFDLKPSEYIERNTYFVIVIDKFGIKNRDATGASQIMWSNDFPHATCEWPHDWEAIEDHFVGVPKQERQAMLADTAARLYKFTNGA